MSKDLSAYKNWLLAAYIYYLKPGEDPRMSDFEWTQRAYYYGLNRAKFQEDEFYIIRDLDFDGSSLYYLTEDDYRGVLGSEALDNYDTFTF